MLSNRMVQSGVIKCDIPYPFRQIVLNPMNLICVSCQELVSGDQEPCDLRLRWELVEPEVGN